MKKIILAGILILAFTGYVFAQATHNSGDTDTWPKAQQFALTNCTAAAINSAVDCGDIKTEGFNALTLEIFYDYAAGTGYTFAIEVCNEGHLSTDCTTATDWYKVATLAPSSGTVTVAPGTFTRVVAADDYLTMTIGINYRRVRVADVVATGSPSSSDKITIVARVAELDSF